MAADQDLDCQDDDVAVRFLLIVRMMMWSGEGLFKVMILLSWFCIT